MRNMRRVLGVVSVTWLVIYAHIHACTEVRVIAEDTSVVVGRSMEWGDDMHSRVRVQPRGHAVVSRAPGGEPGLQWQSRYGYVYMDGHGIDGVTDGMNEKGLSVGVLMGSGQFQIVPDGMQGRALAHTDFAQWVLGNFATVDEVRDALKEIYVWGAPLDLPFKKNMVLPLHFGIYDALGNGIVIEFINEQPRIFDNVVGVLTNDPFFNWHLTNLRNYAGLLSSPAKPMKIGNMTIPSTGQGSGLRGIPGDPTPPSRFVRAAIMAHFADKAANAQEAVTLANHVLYTVDIPLGVLKDCAFDINFKDYSQWIVIKDLTNKHFYFRDYRKSALCRIDLNEIDFVSSAEKLSLLIEDGAPAYIDVTQQLNKTIV